MPGLSFLSKKSWHTTNVKNVERVWLAEQKAEEEQKRLAELQKQLQEERQILELRQLQAAHGQVTKTIDNSLDWMYEGPMSASQKQQSSEDFLLGKIYNSAADHSKVEPAQDVKAPAKWLNKIASKNDSFSRAHEDPFIMIKQEENKRREKVINNPIKMDKIKQKIALELKEKDDNKKRKKAVRKEKKASKKEAKKLKKEAKRRGAENSSNSSSCSESEKDDMNDKAERREEQKCADRMIRSRSRDNSRDRDRRSGGVVDNQEGAPNSRQADTKGRSRLDRRSESRDGNRAFRTRDRSDRGAASDRYSRSHYADRDTRPRRDSRDRQDDRGGHMRESGREQQHRQQRRSPSPGIRGRHSDHHAADDDDRKRPRSPVRDEHADKKPRGDRQHDDGSQSDSSSRGGSRPIKRYGLLPGRNGGSSSSQTSSDSTSLGPNQELLNRKLEAERQAEVARRNRTRIDVKAMSEEERLCKIQEMQMDADHNDMLRTTRHQPSSGASSGDVEGHSGNAVFLESMRKSVYTTGEIDMRSRIDQNKHSRQSSADIDSAEGFIRK